MKKSIVMIVRVLWNGGVAKVALEIQRGFTEMGLESVLYFLRDAGSSYRLPKGAFVVSHNPEENQLFRKILTSITKLFAFHRGKDATVDVDYILSSIPLIINKDYIFFHDQWSSIPGIYLKVLGKKYGLLFHEFFRKPPGMSTYNPLNILAILYDVISIKLASFVIVTSQFNYNIVSKLNRRTKLVRFGFPEPVSSESIIRNFDEERKTVITISLWESGRNPSFYAELAKSLPQLNFIIAGSWAISKEEIDFRSNYSHLSNLKITGRIEEEEKFNLLMNAHFYIRIGYNERGPGLGGLEAMSCGVIPITNRGLGISEIIKHNNTGFIIEEPIDKSAILLLTDLSKRSSSYLTSISMNCLKEAAKYSWKNSAEKIWEQFQLYT